MSLCQHFVDAAFDRHVQLGMSIAPKVHLMNRLDFWQMENIDCGLGDKMENGIEVSHQTGKWYKGQFDTVQHLQTCVEAMQKRVHHNLDPAAVHDRMKVDESSTQKFTGDQAKKDTKEQLHERETKRQRE